MIPQNFIQELLSRLDIVEVVSRHVQLKKTGKNYSACCPFHKEKTPSFIVTPSRQTFKCFGCGAFGNAIGFTMQYEGLSYPEAIRVLAERLGMQVPEDPEARRRGAREKTLSDRMLEAANFYRSKLDSSKRVVDYLKTRQISGETAARFCLGYSPEGWQNLEEIFGEQYKDRALGEPDGCGLVIANEDGRHYDRFRGRLMFPIRNPRGQVIGFGARTLNGDEHPKYLNSPETPIYHKGQEIYGLYEALDAIRASSRAIVCEGYMDVIQLSQAGFKEAVAALGTSITSEHVKKLLKTADKIYFCFDGDSAGQHALRRALEATLPVVGDTQDVRFIVLPPEHDPDSLIKAQGAGAFEEALAKSLSLTEYFVKSVAEGKDLTTPEGRSQFLAQAKPLVVSMRTADILRTQLVNYLAMKARMSPDALEMTFGIAKARPVAPPRMKPRWKGRYGLTSQRHRIQPIPPVASYAERILVNFLSFPELTSEFSDAVEELFVGLEDDLSKEILEVWRAVSQCETRQCELQFLLELLRESPHMAHYRTLLGKEMVLQGSLDDAREETAIAFMRLELERNVVALREAATAQPPDMTLYRELSEYQKSLAQALRKAESALIAKTVEKG